MTKTHPYASPTGTLRKGISARDTQRRANQKRLASAAAVKPHIRNDILPALALVQRDPFTLTAPARNVRGLDAGHIREVVNAISTLGFNVPVLIDCHGLVIDGVVRVEAAKLLNLPMIPCVVIDSLTASELKLLRIAINRLGEKNTWSLDELKLEFEEMVLEDAPIEITGFDLVEIDGILTEVAQVVTEPGCIEPSPGPSTAQPGDVFVLGDHRVICGDARDVTTMYRLMRGDMARFVFTDQPYNVAIAGNVTRSDHREFAMASGEMTEDEFRAFNQTWIGQATRYLVDGGVLATFIDWRGLASVSAAAVTAALSQINLVVWTKTNAGMGSLYRSQHELLPLFKKGDAPHVNNVDLGKKGRSRSNTWTYAGASSMGSDARRGLQDHPTVKPVAMLADALLDVTNRGDVVLDPFLGSGSTLIAAQQTGRVCRGVEIDPLYVDLILRRYEEVTGRAAILEETDETFAALARRRAGERDAVAAVTPEPVPAVQMVEPTPSIPRVRKRMRISTPGA